MGGTSSIRELHRLARIHHVQTYYYDVQGRRRPATVDTLLAVLHSLRVPVSSLADVPQALQKHRQRMERRAIEPVLVAWNGVLNRIALNNPQLQEAALRISIRREDGREQHWTCEQFEVTGGRLHACRRASESLPTGYHRLVVEHQGGTDEALLISAPKRTYAGPDRKRWWGLFIPLYALHSRQSWGAGNFTDLQNFWRYVAQSGGQLVATLPILAAFLDTPFESSPYSPASRLFWNEFYLDIQRIAELEQSAEAQQLVASHPVQEKLAELRDSRWVDYRQQMALQRQVVEKLAKHCFDHPGARRDELNEFLKSRPEVETYARFRATGERLQNGWLQWPERQRSGNLQEGDFDQPAWRYHVYAQWVAHEQMGELVQEARSTGGGLYLDLPLGVHREGYDTWRERDVFALDASGGAPPDAVFTKGQDWGFAPLHPEQLRAQGYRHWIDLLRHHLSHAGMLRIDHVMGLHRLYFVPRGMPASKGAYVRYPAEELYAVLSVESHRYGSTLVGENLGTVPSYVNAAMKRHGIGQMYVVQYEANTTRRSVLSDPPRRSVASLNTHDMPPLAAFWEGRELDDLHQQGLFNEEEVQQQRKTRELLRQRLIDFLEQEGILGQPPDVAAVRDALHAFLARSDAEFVLMNLEDLWLEQEPQNMPGTSEGRRNWQRKARQSLEELMQLPQVSAQLKQLSGLRNSKKRAKWPETSSASTAAPEG